MEPIPEVRAAALQLAALSEETVDLLPTLTAVSAIAQSLLPSCVGVSITLVVDGDAFTVTATADDIRTVDAAQYLDGGPCVHAAVSSEQVLVDDVLDEHQWQLFAQAATHLGIRASLSLPLRDPDGQAIGAMNLYASDAAAFTGQQDRLAEMFGARASELMANADLSFRTRDSARELPQRLADHEEINQAIGVLMAVHGWTADAARERLDYAASAAGTSRVAVARTVMVLDT